MRRGLTALGALCTVCSLVPLYVGTSGATAPPLAAADNGYGPGDGPQSPGIHWGGAYVLQGVPGYAYCIAPGAADPVELPTYQWSPVAYPGSSVYTNGQMAALADFANRYETVGYDGYSVDDTVAAIAEVAYASARGVTPPSSAAPSALVADIEQWIVSYAGPWHITLTMTPPSGAPFDATTNYYGTITLTSATGAGVPGIQFIAPPVGGPASGQISNFVWLDGFTNATGQMGFAWNIGAPGSGAGQFSATIGVIGGAAGAAPPTYAAAPGSGGQEMLVAGSTETLSTGFDGTVDSVAATGTLSIEKSVPDPAYYGPGGAVFQVIAATGSVEDTLTIAPTGSTPSSKPLPATTGGTPYTVREVGAPTGYGSAPDQVARVYPSQNTVVSYSGAYEEPVLAAQLGAAKVDAQSNQALAGATFAFRFDRADDGVYDQTLGSCTTGASGTCQPPVENAPGGWLPGWYQVTETAAPPGYWLDPTTAVRHVYLQPGAQDIASVTFADELLGSLQLAKTGNDTAYLSVAGAVFQVTGPAPSTAIVGTLTVGTGGTTNTLAGLVPGSYTLTETTPPPGYAATAPFTVSVSAGRATTEVTAADPVQPGELAIAKTDASTGAPLAGATFDTRFDSHDDGAFDVDLGTCTTDSTGRCAPPTNDGAGFLPGTYEVTETAAPAGYALPSQPVKTLTVPAGGTVIFSFADAMLVPASFVKVATGNVNSDELHLAGAVIDVSPGTSWEAPAVTGCTTSADGRCTTAPVLISGSPYCWKEVAAPTGLAPGASGCFTATNAQGAEPITMVDPGMFVAIRAEKVDSADPSYGIAGATFDLYRVDGDHIGGPAPPPPSDAAVEPGQTWVARGTTNLDGAATFPLQLPGYAYCTVEQHAPADYVANPTEHCTPVLSGSTQVPPPVETVVTEDAEAMVTVSARKFNAADPNTGIPGAVYDLYVEGLGPPSHPPSTPPSGPSSAVTAVPGDRWWARGVTSTGGELHFTVPAGYAWCLKEVSAPVDYVMDAGLHCTTVITTTTPPPALTVALPETVGLVDLYTHKYNALQPDTTIPGAAYELVGQGAVPPGWSPPANPSAYTVPTGDWYVGTATTDGEGVASWSVPAGYAWCLHEVAAPPGYEIDAGWHCTGVVSTTSPLPDETVALPEAPAPPLVLAFTGGPPPWLLGAGVGLAALGGLLFRIGRRRSDQGRRPTTTRRGPRT